MFSLLLRTELLEELACVCGGGGGWGGGGGGKHLLNGCQIDVLLILSEQNMLLQTV